MAVKVRYTSFDGEVVEENRGATLRDYVPDRFSSTVALLDTSQVKTYSAQYWPFGEVATQSGSTQTSLKFRGTLGGYLTSGIVLFNPVFDPRTVTWIQGVVKEAAVTAAKCEKMGVSMHACDFVTIKEVPVGLFGHIRVCCCVRKGRGTASHRWSETCCTRFLICKDDDANNYFLIVNASIDEGAKGGPGDQSANWGKAGTMLGAALMVAAATTPLGIAALCISAFGTDPLGESPTDHRRKVRHHLNEKCKKKFKGRWCSCVDACVEEHRGAGAGNNNRLNRAYYDVECCKGW